MSAANSPLLAALSSLDVLHEDLTKYDMEILGDMGLVPLSEGVT